MNETVTSVIEIDTEDSDEIISRLKEAGDKKIAEICKLNPFFEEMKNEMRIALNEKYGGFLDTSFVFEYTILCGTDKVARFSVVFDFDAEKDAILMKTSETKFYGAISNQQTGRAWYCCPHCGKALFPLRENTHIEHMPFRCKACKHDIEVNV